MAQFLLRSNPTTSYPTDSQTRQFSMTSTLTLTSRSLTNSSRISSPSPMMNIGTKSYPTNYPTMQFLMMITLSTSSCQLSNNKDPSHSMSPSLQYKHSNHEHTDSSTRKCLMTSTLTMSSLANFPAMSCEQLHKLCCCQATFPPTLSPTSVTNSHIKPYVLLGPNHSNHGIRQQATMAIPCV